MENYRNVRPPSRNPSITEITDDRITLSNECYIEAYA